MDFATIVGAIAAIIAIVGAAFAVIRAILKPVTMEFCCVVVVDLFKTQGQLGLGRIIEAELLSFKMRRIFQYKFPNQQDMIDKGIQMIRVLLGEEDIQQLGILARAEFPIPLQLYTQPIDQEGSLSEEDWMHFSNNLHQIYSPHIEQMTNTLYHHRWKPWNQDAFFERADIHLRYFDWACRVYYRNSINDTLKGTSSKESGFYVLLSFE